MATFKFDDHLSGYISTEATDPAVGFRIGQDNQDFAEFHVTIGMSDMEKFVGITGRVADLTGTITIPGIGEKLPITQGNFVMFQIDENAEDERTRKKLEYKIHFQDYNGNPYYFYGHKKIFHDKGKMDLLTDMTTLYSYVYKGNEIDDKKLFGCGILRYKLGDYLPGILSFRVEGAKNTKEKALVMTQFFDFFYEGLLEVYFNNRALLYRTDYRNFILSGKCTYKGQDAQMFMYSGAHDQGFPWNDNEAFTDVSFVFVYDKGGEKVVDRYVYAETVIEKDYEIYLSTDLEKQEMSRFAYKGKLYQVVGTNSVSFCDDIQQADKSKVLVKTDCDVAVEFIARVPKDKGVDVPALDLPFAVPEGFLDELLVRIDEMIKKWFSSEKRLGIRCGIRSADVKKISLKIGSDNVDVDIDGIHGEAEDGTIEFFHEPTLDYKYICAINPAEKIIDLNVEGGVLFNDTVYYAKNAFDKVISRIGAPFAQAHVVIKDDDVKEWQMKAGPDQDLSPPILEVNFDHFDTAVFLRRVILVNDKDLGKNYALEENVRRINLRRRAPAVVEKPRSPLDKEEALVVVRQSQKKWADKQQDPYHDQPGLWDNFKSLFNLHGDTIDRKIPKKERMQLENQDKLELLNQVADKSGLIPALTESAKKNKVKKKDLRIIIKPNFMFTYNKADHTTYTDPVLIHGLIKIIYEAGFENISVVEAQSTYGQYYYGRKVVEVAKYIGLTGSVPESPEITYKIVDLTEDERVEPVKPFNGPLKGEKVPKTWQDAHFRISFAKNKTHSYAFYTHTIKCIYGSLPRKNKFKHYHCDLGIYGTTIEYIFHYPIHFGFIDAYVSADGPFGIFADKTPNYTRTIIGGDNIVAVDWVGSSKMGINPTLSTYMSKAAIEFGKPRIRLNSNAREEIYRPWENIPIQMPKMLDEVLDKHYRFGNLFYWSGSQMDEKAFPPRPQPLYIKIFRWILAPIRKMVFVEGSPTLMKILYALNPESEPDDKAVKDAINQQH